MSSEARALGERAQAMIGALAAVSDEPDGLTRLYLTPAHRRAADLVCNGSGYCREDRRETTQRG